MTVADLCTILGVVIAFATLVVKVMDSRGPASYFGLPFQRIFGGELLKGRRLRST